MSKRSGPTDIEHSEDMLRAAMMDAPADLGGFYEDILEVLAGRREQVESLRQQLRGAVTACNEAARLVRLAQGLIGERRVDLAAAHLVQTQATLAAVLRGQ